MAKKNKYISVTFTGYGHYKIEGKVYGKSHSVITTDMKAIDNYNSVDDGRKNRGYKTLVGYLNSSYKRTLPQNQWQ